MSRGVWDEVRSSKGFNVFLYRKLGSMLVLSVALNVMLCILASFVYFSRPDFEFYSTDGVSPPVRLQQLNAPNESSVPLLKTAADLE